MVVLAIDPFSEHEQLMMIMRLAELERLLPH